MKTIGKGLLSATVGLIAFGLLLFVPAGTLHYWQAWVFLAAFAVSTWIPSMYLIRTNPAALERRMRVGPAAETRPAQRIIIAVIFVCFPAMFALSALDHRLGWSTVPTPVCLLGDALVAAGLLLAMAVVIQNGYAAANVTVEADQTLVSTGLYGVVRHPMYTGNVIMMIGVPLALGSYWGLVFLAPGLIVLVLRIRDEEELLNQELAGYRDYTQQIRYRLVPGIW
ncbi:isoprenylcysteine carboxylmethyltransferase family protein [Mycolicibacter sp. MYC123]|uniref:Isoprenylcysteine carboxylmethyltransferase family protein n=1 Tax=[Mycobacterium] zoologicum TaxID=2872311 RepID=A0ABU5YLH4_9MYCO|nr:isoprenylcysteine carboxylmethyltransferase family protein [Mycolicibacter sp. MYC123]MEB3050911.1 isoprenylcysteine carboxylmethyltransferase family protein [Mycolicibacter sp. MYC123]